MPRNDIQKLILSEIKDLKSEIKEVRQTDIPNLRKAVGVFETEIASIKEKGSVKTTIITTVGGLLAVATSMAVAYLR